MPDPGALVASVAIAVVVLVMLAFTLGTQRNVRKGNDQLRWLQGALPRIGRRTTLRWLGSSAVQLDIVEPEEPFREATVLVVLEPRDVPLVWAISRSRGRRDVVIFRLNLRRAPRIELEAAAPSAWLSSGEADEAAAWRPIDWPAEARASAGGELDPATLAVARSTWLRLAEASGGMWRLSVRRTVPHLEVHFRPPDTGTVAADRIIEPIRELARALVRS